MLHSTLPTVKPLQGSVPLYLNFTTNYNDTGIAAGVKLLRVNASTKKPVLLRVRAEVVTAFNAATTNVLTIGTDAASANQILGAADITEGTPGFYPSTGNIGYLRLIADTDVYVKYTQTGTAATTGVANLYLEFMPLF